MRIDAAPCAGKIRHDLHLPRCRRGKLPPVETRRFASLFLQTTRLVNLDFVGARAIRGPGNGGEKRERRSKPTHQRRPDGRENNHSSVRKTTQGGPQTAIIGAMDYDAIEALCRRCETKRQAAAIWAIGLWEMFFAVMLAHPSLTFDAAEHDLRSLGADPPYLPSSPGDASSSSS